MRRVVRLLLAARFVGLGVWALVHRDLAPIWTPVPRRWPAREILTATQMGLFTLLVRDLLDADRRRLGGGGVVQGKGPPPLNGLDYWPIA